MRVSLDPARWPAREVILPFSQKTKELILRDGTRVQSGGPAVEPGQSGMPVTPLESGKIKVVARVASYTE
jgi:hypothetical protein